MQLTVVRAHAEALDHRTTVHGNFAVGHHHAFGLPCGARGVNQVRLMTRQADKRQLSRRVIAQFLRDVFQAPERDVLRQLAQGVKQRTVTQQQTNAAVFNHVVQAFQRIFRVQRYVGAPRLEDRQQADHHLQRSLKGQAHTHLRSDTALAQPPRQPVSTAVQFGVAQVLAGEGQRDGVGAKPCLFSKQAMNAQVQRMFGNRRGHALHQLLLLWGQHQRQLAQALLRIAQQRLQQVAPVPGHFGDARFVKQIGTVRQAATQTMVKVSDFQVEVKLGGTRIVGQVLNAHPCQFAALLELPALHVAHDLEQRVIGRAARWLQRFDQMIEGQVLMRLTFNHGLTHLFYQFAHTHLRIELATQHLGVEEGADQPFAFRADAVGDRCADAQIALATVAIEQHRQRGSHGHEQRQAMLGIESPHPRRQFVAQVEAVQLTLIALHRGPRTVARQLQQRVFAAQFGGPVIELALTLARLQPLALPHAVIQVLHGQRSQR